MRGGPFCPLVFFLLCDFVAGFGFDFLKSNIFKFERSASVEKTAQIKLSSALEPSSQPSTIPSSVPTSKPTFSGLNNGVFGISTLTGHHSYALNVSRFIGNDTIGGLSVSTTSVLLTGSQATLSLPKSDLSTSSKFLSSSMITMVSDLQSQNVYAIADENGDLIVGEGIIAYLLQVSSTGGLIGSKSSATTITLNKPIKIGFNSAFFSGYNRIVIADGDSQSVFSIDLLNGNFANVLDLGKALIRWSPSDCGFSWGVAEFTYQNKISIVYGTPTGLIERQVVGLDNAVGTVFDAGALGLGNLAEFTVDITQNRWYFHYKGEGAFGNYTETLGYADATFMFLFPSSLPTSVPSSSSPTGQGLYVGLFDIGKLTAENAIVLDSSGFFINDTINGIALSSDSLFLSGDRTGNAIAIPNNNISSVNNTASVVIVQNETTPTSGLVSDLATERVYILANNEYQPVSEHGDLIYYIIPVDSTTGSTIGQVPVPLQSPIRFGANSAFLSGYHRIVVLDGCLGVGYNIYPLNGKVLVLGKVLNRWALSLGGATRGVAGFSFDDTVHATYGAPGGLVERQSLGNGYTISTMFNTRTLAVGDLTAFTVGISNQRWYFHIQGRSDIGNTTTDVLGYADAVMLMSYPTSNPTEGPKTPKPTTSAPTNLGLEVGIFGINKLTIDRFQSFNVSRFLGNDSISGIAMAQSSVILTGRDGMVNITKTNMTRESVATSSVFRPSISGVASDYATSIVWVLTDSDLKPVQCPGTVSFIVPLSTSTMQLNKAHAMPLSQPLRLGMDSMILSGYRRIVAVDGDTGKVYNIAIVNGYVYRVGKNLARILPTRSGLSTAVAEFAYEHRIHLVYSGLNGLIERQMVGEGVENQLEDLFQANRNGLGDLSAFTVDPVVGKWYFVYKGRGMFGNYTETFGYADATFERSLPTSTPSSRPSTSVPSSSVPTSSGLTVEGGIFGVTTLSKFASRSQVVDVTSIYGDEKSTAGLAITETGGVLVTGSKATFGYNFTASGKFHQNTKLLQPVGGLVSDLATDEVFVLCDSNHQPITQDGGVLSIVYRMNPYNGVYIGEPVNLTQSIRLGSDSMVYSGYNRFVVSDGDSGMVFNIWLVNGTIFNGHVLYLGKVLNRQALIENDMMWGVAEFSYENAVNVLYNSVGNIIERQNVGFMNSDNLVSTVFNANTLGLGDLTTFTVDRMHLVPCIQNGPPVCGKWFFHTTNGTNQFLGWGAAQFMHHMPSSLPTSQPSTSKPSSHPTSHPTNTENFFGIILTTNNYVSFDIGSYVGNDTVNAVGLSPNRVYVTGAGGTLSLEKEQLSLQSQNVIRPPLFALVTDLADNQMYMITDKNLVAIGGDGGIAIYLVPVNSTSSGDIIFPAAPVFGLSQSGNGQTIILNPPRGLVKLTRPVRLGADSTIHSGYKVCTLVDADTDRVFEINTLRGSVVFKGKNVPRYALSDHQISHGITEVTQERKVHISYGATGGFIERQIIGYLDQNNVETLVTGPGGLGDITSFIVDRNQSRWYFHYRGNGIFGNFSNTFGSADADSFFHVPSSLPTSEPSTSVPSTSVPTGTGLTTLLHFGVASLSRTGEATIQIKNSELYGNKTINPYYYVGGITMERTSVKQWKMYQAAGKVTQYARNVYVTGNGATESIPVAMQQSGRISMDAYLDQTTNQLRKSAHQPVTIGTSPQPVSIPGMVSVFQQGGDGMEFDDLRIENYILLDEDFKPFRGNGYVVAIISLKDYVNNWYSGSTNITMLTNPILLGEDSMVFSAFQRIVLVDGMHNVAFNVRIQNGYVLFLGKVLNRWAKATSGLGYGVAEFNLEQKVHLDYFTAEGTIERQIIADDNNVDVLLPPDSRIKYFRATDLVMDESMWCYRVHDYNYTHVSCSPLTSFLAIPTSQPSMQPSIFPSMQPSSQPSSNPTQPTGHPSSQPSRQPSCQPSCQPTGQPSDKPSQQPSGYPSIQPSLQPSDQPSSQPTSRPSQQPSLQPSRQPSSQPSRLPSMQPSAQPSRQPTAQPSRQPSLQPTQQPSRHPSTQPSYQPSRQPTSQPTSQPSRQPTSQPSRYPSSQPTRHPSRQPSSQPSRRPSCQPTSQPSRQPSGQPSRQPTFQPSSQPSRVPSSQPTTQPSRQPSSQPTMRPSMQPSIQPTLQPSGQPTSQPSLQPTSQPTCQPSLQPSSQPSQQPSGQPTSEPSMQPSLQPSRQPSNQPISQPSQQPSCQPSSHPSMQPSSQPSFQPSMQPSIQPSYQPSSQPSTQPSLQPTSQPTMQPSIQPTAKPSQQPTSQPSMKPSIQPTSQPSMRPSIQPTSHPSMQPSSQPSMKPSSQPSTIPSMQPSNQPVLIPTSKPSIAPTGQPSSQPIQTPSTVPSMKPTHQPSTQPTAQPSGHPSTQPTVQPSVEPSIQPTSQPSCQPSVQPSAQPSSQPSRSPTGQPSAIPSVQPSAQPTVQPSIEPSNQPSIQPSKQPSIQPTSQPSYQPLVHPSMQPSAIPSTQPSSQPSVQPTSEPSTQPTVQPSKQPSNQPSQQPSLQPSTQPSLQPTSQPSSRPSAQPSQQPTTQPSSRPSTQPSLQPSAQPSADPSCQPTAQPTQQPSEQPTALPSQQPSFQPSSQPSEQPSSLPSQQPTSQPSSRPSVQPTSQPSFQPSMQPSSKPSVQPSGQPSRQPSFQPSCQPSLQPTVEPSSQPTDQPIMKPSSQPSSQPTVEPSGQPSRCPSMQPTSQPSSRPSTQPTSLPSSQPSHQPVRSPTGQPSRQPRGQPTRQPSRQPTSQPSRQPVSQPSGQPSRQPYMQPTARPSRQPYMRPTSQPSRQPFRRPTGQPSRCPSSQPTRQPFSFPTAQPSQQPSQHPTLQPFDAPSMQPSAQPVGWPTMQPSIIPSSHPSAQPVLYPTSRPTKQPFSHPTGQPSRQPTRQPTRQPFSHPTSRPSRQPTVRPSRAAQQMLTFSITQELAGMTASQWLADPNAGAALAAVVSSVLPKYESFSVTFTSVSEYSRRLEAIQRLLTSGSTSVTYSISFVMPTNDGGPADVYSKTVNSIETSVSSGAFLTRLVANAASFGSTALMRVTTVAVLDVGEYSLKTLNPRPSTEPTSKPTGQPTVEPSSQPSVQPSSEPTQQPTNEPTSQPSNYPSSHPTVTPSQLPSSKPTHRPTTLPTSRPSREPSIMPSQQPTAEPSSQPSMQPLAKPTRQPTAQPSRTPSRQPSSQPTTIPTNNPSCRPSSRPSKSPSTIPTVQPSSLPSSQPSVQPSSLPTRAPSSIPSVQPSQQPTNQPSSAPSRMPSCNPSNQPTSMPSSQPSRMPTSAPTNFPSTQPTSVPTVQPSSFPSMQPTGQPSSQPTRVPTLQPTSRPSRFPTSQPTMQPSVQPTAQPSNRPTVVPTSNPSAQPLAQPTSRPSIQPSRQPSTRPSLQPTTFPSVRPSVQPSTQPSQQPSSRPSNIPTLQPSVCPSEQPSVQPSRQPSNQPSSEPSCQPTSVPSSQPYSTPSSQPSSQPTDSPSNQPSIIPSGQPSGSPSVTPSRQPTQEPFSQPSMQPSTLPSAQPSNEPSNRPSSQPSIIPSAQPSSSPTDQPSSQPSKQPTSQPSGQPTQAPTSQPSQQPSGQPTVEPSMQPSQQPTRQPSGQPTRQPTRRPSCHPTGQPSMQPTRQPTCQPTSQPTMDPTRQPTSSPSRQPTRQPTSQPTQQPTCQPTMEPTQQPSSRPSLQPTGRPTAEPTSQPSSRPSLQPFSRPTMRPSAQPTSKPSMDPSSQPTSKPTLQPFAKPTGEPTSQPSSKPTKQPTSIPTGDPTIQPSSHPSSQPVLIPTSRPTCQPTDIPSMQPSSIPSSKPTKLPSTPAPAFPTTHPTGRPTSQPSRCPSGQPTVRPSRVPTGQPSGIPSTKPSVQPSSQPFALPSAQPSSQPSSMPSKIPSRQPSGQPSRQPYARPTAQPTRAPSSQPTRQPTRIPSSQPSIQPTSQPSNRPSRTPSSQPTCQPSSRPSSKPSRQPSSQPSQQPSAQPSSQPSRQPTVRPTTQPSRQPTSQPSSQPSRQPSTQPSKRPSSQPTRQPTSRPSVQPTSLPTSQPSKQPIKSPTAQPSQCPSTQPTTQPSFQPSSKPSRQPSSQPSSQPSKVPSSQPTTQPSKCPSSHPTRQPTSQPSSQPSRQPSSQPSRQPTSQPTSHPSQIPSSQPSQAPSAQPSRLPTSQPSNQPISHPTAQPSRCPSSQPSRQPTTCPSQRPSSQPTRRPSAQPSSIPFAHPTGKPSRVPTGQPSRMPSTQPSGRPSRIPTSQPTRNPSVQPSSRPSKMPSSQPSGQPSCIPSSRPTFEPTSLPTSQPSCMPTRQPTRVPTKCPSSQPSIHPSAKPSAQPSKCPSTQPTRQPNSRPTVQPSVRPSAQPSRTPSGHPTTQPSMQPVGLPTSQPSYQPSSHPTVQPISRPSGQPTSSPTKGPSVQPSSQPTRRPSRKPSAQPSRKPSQSPSSKPSEMPSGQPTAVPSKTPSGHPSRIPTSQPILRPTRIPTSQPIGRPTSRPTKYYKPTTEPSSRPSQHTVLVTVSQVSFKVSQSLSGISALDFMQPSSVDAFQSAILAAFSGQLGSGATVQIISANDATPSQNKLKQGQKQGKRLLQSSGVTVVYSITVLAFGGISPGSAYTQAQSELTSFVSNSGPSGFQSTMLTLAAANGSPLVNAVSTPLASGSIGQYTTVTENLMVAPPTSHPSSAPSQNSNRTVGWVQAPVQVFGSESKYVGSVANFFTFMLSGNPEYDLTVDVVVSSNTSTVVQTPDLEVKPTSIFKFTHTSTVLQGSFYLNGSPDLAGTYYIYLMLSGRSSLDFHPEPQNPFTVAVISSFAPLPPPTFTSVVFDGSGAFVTFTFSAPTDYAAVYPGLSLATFPCSLLFTYTGASMATCTWTSSSTVVGQFGDYIPGLLSPGNPVLLVPNVLRQECLTTNAVACRRNIPASIQSVVATAPSNPILPQIIINSPTAISQCAASMEIDATSTVGAAGRPWLKTFWTVNVTKSTVPEFMVDDFYPLPSVKVLRKMQSFMNLQSIANPIVIDRSLYEVGFYQLQLTVVNFLGAKASVVNPILVSGQSSMPQVVIQGNNIVTMLANQQLISSGSASIASCGGSNTTALLKYNWFVLLNGTNVPVNSSSLDPTQFVLPTYSLVAGNTYVLQLTVYPIIDGLPFLKSSSSATINVVVNHGEVRAAVRGGYLRSSPQDKVLMMDASPPVSYDEDENPKGVSHLAFLWTCTIGSQTFENISGVQVSMFGHDCGVFGSKGILRTPACVMRPMVLQVNVTYLFSVTVTSTIDGRSDKKIVTVQPSLPGSVFISITSTATQINTDAQLSLNGFLSANFTVLATWSLYFGTTPVELNSLTANSQLFQEADAKKMITYPLAVGAYTFTPGRQYTFRLTGCNPLAAGLCSFGQLNININAPPYGGKVKVIPTKGYGLTTKFTVLSPGWLTTPKNYPLFYIFVYNTDPILPPLVIQSRSTITFASSTLPTGDPMKGGNVTVTGVVSDVFDCATNTSVIVKTRTNPKVKISTILKQALATFQSSGNVNPLYQAVNGGSSTMNILNCTKSPNCAKFNRGSCLTVPNTCESCLPGFTGVIGPDNSRCFNESTTDGMVGSPCNNGRDCRYGECTVSGTDDRNAPVGVCTEPLKRCPTNDPRNFNSVCSGHGTCEYLDPSGSPMEPCRLFSTLCTTQCVCQPGWMEEDCSLTPAGAAALDASRTTMCYGLLASSSLQNKSPKLMDSIVTSLSSSFQASQVYTPEGRAACSAVMQFLTDLALEGYLVGTQPKTAAFMTSTASAFISHNNTNSSAHSAATAALSGITAGILQGMVGGQPAVPLTSNGIRVAIQHPLVSSMGNATLGPPATGAEAAYGTIQPKVAMPGAGLGACGIPGGYAQLSINQFGKNPYAGSEGVKSPVLGMSTSSPANTVSRRRLDLQTHYTDIQEVLGTPKFFISVQFAAKRNFNFSALDSGNRRANVTLPACTFHNGIEYQPCTGCNVSSYTDFNVTFGCYDIAMLCPPGSDLHQRRLLERGEISEDQRAAEAEYFNAIGHGRGLQSYDDDVSKKGSSGGDTAAQFAALLAAILAQIAAVLSSNPFAMNPAANVAILTFEACLLATIFAGIYIFLKWDTWDHNFHMYLKDEKKAYVRRLLAEDISKGGDGRAFLVEAQKIEMEKAFSIRNIVQEISDSFKPPKKQGAKNSADSVLMNEVNHPVLSNDKDEIVEEPDPVKTVADRHEMSALLSDFFDIVAPPDTLLRGDGGMLRTWCNAMLLNHSYSAMFTGVSLLNTRLCRWLTLVRGVLINIFVDTLFFQLLQPAGSCMNPSTKEMCLMAPNSVTGEPLCMWDKKSEQCSLRPLPDTPVYTYGIPLMIIIFSVPVDIIVGIFQDEIASKRPDMEAVGLSTDGWIGSGSPEYEDDEDGGKPQKPSELGRVFMDRALTGFSPTELNNMAKLVFEDFKSPDEELVYILGKVKQYFAAADEEAPNESDPNFEAKRRARVGAIVNQLGVFPNGDPVPLSIWHRIRFNTPHHKLVDKIRRARTKSERISGMVGEFEDEESDYKDCVMIQSFILEQLEMYRRYGLRNQFFIFDALVPETTNFFAWFFAWIIVSGTIAFFCYWPFAWGVHVGKDSMAAWGQQFGVAIAQDAMMMQPFKIFIVNCVAIELAKPQMRVIYRTLNAVATTYVQDGIDKNDEFRVVQHLSPACRASRLHHIKDLPAAYILRQVDDVDVDKCRAHRHFSLGTIAFLCISIPALIAMIDETIADMAIDNIVGFGCTAFLIANQTLYDLGGGSEAAGMIIVMIPYEIMVGLIVYKLYVLGPSIKHVIQNTTLSRSTTKRWQQSKRSMNKGGTMGFIWNLCCAAYDWLARLQVTLIMPFLYDNEGNPMVRSEQDLRHNAWQKMNNPLTIQGQLLDDETIDNIFSKAAPGSVDIPVQILSMRPPEWSADWNARGSSTLKATSARIFNQLPDDDLQGLVDLDKMLVMYAQEKGAAGPAATKMNDSLFTMNVHTALQRMFKDRFKGESLSSVNDDEIYFLNFLDKSSDDNIIYASELEVLLEATWETFIPGGQVLSEDEKGEVREAFQLWASTYKDKKKSKKTKKRAAPGTVKITDFCKWFIKFHDQIVETRHNAQHIPAMDMPVEEYATTSNPSTASASTTSDWLKSESGMDSLADDAVSTSESGFFGGGWLNQLTSSGSSESAPANWADYLSSSDSGSGSSAPAGKQWVELLGSTGGSASGDSVSGGASSYRRK